MNQICPYCAIIKDKPLSRWNKFFVANSVSSVTQQRSVHALKHMLLFVKLSTRHKSYFLQSLFFLLKMKAVFQIIWGGVSQKWLRRNITYRGCLLDDNSLLSSRIWCDSHLLYQGLVMELLKMSGYFTFLYEP